jgi:hypothetical protein
VQKLIPLTDPDQMVANGLPFKTVHSARWEYRKAKERGTSAAFVRIGGRVYIDPERYHEAIREAQ